MKPLECPTCGQPWTPGDGATAEVNGVTVRYSWERECWEHAETGQPLVNWRRWAVSCQRNPWLSLGVHIDHKNPYIALHLPGAIVELGRVWVRGFRNEEK